MTTTERTTRKASRQTRRAHPGSDEELRAFEAAAITGIALPAAAHVIGEPVTVTEIRDLGLLRYGLLATCLRGERAYEVNLADVVFPAGSAGATLVSRYRGWLGFDTTPLARRPSKPALPNDPSIAVGQPVDLIVLECKSNALRCRVRGTSHELTLRVAVRDEIPGSIIHVTPTKSWTHARHPYLSGEIKAIHVDVRALDLTPLALHRHGDWDPEEEYWGEDDEPIDDWAQPIIARGKRPMFEMEQVIPGADPEDMDSDPIVEAAERNTAGDREGARRLLMSLCGQDLRGVDAHATSATSSSITIRSRRCGTTSWVRRSRSCHSARILPVYWRGG